MKEKLFSVTLKDCEVRYYRGSGAGGQKRNKTASAAEIKHIASGAIGRCETYREQSRNRNEAFKCMSQTKEFQTWVDLEARCVSGDIMCYRKNRFGLNSSKTLEDCVLERKLYGEGDI